MLFFPKSQFIIIILKTFYHSDKIKIKTILIEEEQRHKTAHLYNQYASTL